MRTGLLATLLGVVNAFIVMIIGILYLYGSTLSQSYVLGGLCLLLGLLGIVLTFVLRFRTSKKLVQSKKEG